MMISTRRWKQPLLAIGTLYFYIYNPMLKPGIAIGGTILILISLIYAIAKRNIVLRYIKYYRTELLFSLFVLLYIFVVCSINGEDYVLPRSLILWILVSTIVPVFLVREVLVRNKDISFWELILEVGFVASVISCIALFSPPVNNFLRSIQMELDMGDGDMLEDQLDFRCFGFAFYLTSRYGYVQGLLASLCLLRFDSRHRRYALYFLTLFISVIINARTGLFPIGLTVLWLVCKNVVRCNLFRLLKICIVSILGVFVISQVLNSLPDVRDFFMDFIDQLSFIFIDSEFENSAYSKMLFFPDTVTGLVFGEGHRATGVLDSSDIGYVNQIFYGGIIFVGSLLIYEFIVYRKIVKWSKDYVWPTIFLVSMLIFNYKGAWFTDSLSAFVRIWILYYYVLVHNRLEPQKGIRLR